MTEHSLIDRLRERKMVQWAVAYGAGALVLLEIADFLADAFNWPSIALRILSVVVGFGFLAVLVIAWYHGEQGHQRVRPVEAVLLSLIGLSGAGTAWWMTTRVEPAAAVADPAGDPADDLLLTAANEDGRTGIAIMPFEGIGATADDAAFIDGITEDVIAEIARVDGLRVISRTSVMQYRGTSKTVPEIGRELGVDVILEGSVQRVGQDVRINAQLIDARTDEHLWSATYDRNIKDILKVQSEVAADIAGQMRTRLGVPLQLATAERPEVDPAALEQAMEGRHLAASASAEERRKGMEMLYDAVSMDSNVVFFALPAVADVGPAFEASAVGDVPAPPDPLMDRVVTRMMRHAPDAPAARTIGIRRALDDRDFDRAERLARQAVEENPNNAMAHRYLGLLLGRSGRTDEAIAQLRAARRLDPHSEQIGTDLGEMLYAAGRTDEAIEQLNTVLREHPRHVPARVALGLAYQAAGQDEAAVAALRQAAAESDHNPMVMGSLGYVFATQGAVESARAVLDTLRVSTELRGGTRIAIAQVMAGLGEIEEAARVLQDSTAGRARTMSFQMDWLRMDPKLRVLFPDSSTAGRRVP